MLTVIEIKQAIAKVVQLEHLTREEARQTMNLIMNGDATPAQIASLITALRMKGETVDEITGFAEVMRSKANRVSTERKGLLDTCGTGGSGIHKFNISTASAIVAASLGIRVAKHGNRAMSGRSGSADVLEALGVHIGLNHEQASVCLDKTGLCFMFAQLYHPSMKHAAGPRREIGVRTIFNMLGPLTNPAGADRQLMGLFDRHKTETVANVLRELNLARALVVGSVDGLDEISVSVPTIVTELQDGNIRTYEITPESLGLRRHSIEAIAGGDAQDNAELIRRLLQGEKNPYRDVVLANAGACAYVADYCDSLAEGVQLAASAIDSGKAFNKLEQLIQITGELSHVSG